MFPHGGPIVISGGSIIGDYVIIHPDVLLGGERFEGAPIIGNRVFIGHGTKIVGHISVGDDVFIAPGTVVVRDIPTGCVVVGNPARIISNKGSEYVRKYLVEDS